MRLSLLLASVLCAVSARPYRWPGEQTILSGSMTDKEYANYINYLKMLGQDEQLGSDFCSAHHDHYFYDLMELTYQCPVPVKRFPPGNDDGGKWACQLENMPPGSIVYSIGSEGNYIFEEQMLKLGFKLFTFDCYGDYGNNAPPGLTFNKWCTDGHDHAPFYKLTTMMSKLGHERIDFLKMDIEGGEFSSLPVLAELPKERRPKQIAVEIHSWGTGYARASIRPFDSLKTTINLMLQLHEMGYKLMTREDNRFAPCCSEFVYMLQ